jgi:hypothetical protein
MLKFGVWEIYASVGLLVTAAVHAACWHVIVPTGVLVAGVLFVFPSFAVAIWRHQAQRTSHGETSVPLWRAFSGVPLWFQVGFWATVPYLLWLWSRIPETEFSLLDGMSSGQRLIASFVTTFLFAAALGMLWSRQVHDAAP